MAPSKIRRALGAVKDRTSIGLAKVSSSNSISDLDVAIVKATRHEEQPAEEKHVREILSLTCYSRAYISSCVNTLSRRLNKTKNWTVALKTLMLIHRLLLEGDPAYEQEMFFATRRGTRLLNMSDFRDSRSNSDSWDYSAFVRTYALYLDEQLEFRMYGRKRRTLSMTMMGDEDDQDYFEEEPKLSTGTPSSTVKATPVRDMKTEQVFTRTQHLQNLIDRFLACRPTGVAKNNRVVIVALYSIVKDSFQIYTDLTEVMAILIDRFIDLDIPECTKIHDIFVRLGKQFEDLNAFYNWSKAVGIARSSEYPDVERIPSKKLQLMDEFIREKLTSMRDSSKEITNDDVTNNYEVEQEPPEAIAEQEQDMNSIKALPPPEGWAEQVEEQKEPEITKKEEKTVEEEVDFLNLRDNNSTMTSEEREDKLALALFDGTTGATTTTSKWEAFNEEAAGGNWETALVVSSSDLKNQKATLGGGFDMLLLNGMYEQQATAMANGVYGATGSASSVAFGSAGKPASPMLALPAPPLPSSSASSSNNNTRNMNFSGVNVDPFAASLMVAPPTYVQLSEMEKKQKLLMEEQMMWEQYARDGMQGHIGMRKPLQRNPYGMGGY